MGRCDLDAIQTAPFLPRCVAAGRTHNSTPWITSTLIQEPLSADDGARGAAPFVHALPRPAGSADRRERGPPLLERHRPKSEQQREGKFLSAFRILPTRRIQVMFMTPG